MNNSSRSTVKQNEVWNLAVGDSGMLYFQDMDSYSQGSRFGVPAGVEPTVVRVLEHQSSSVFEYEKALANFFGARCAASKRRLHRDVVAISMCL
jgi:hypothetical protein